MGRRAETALAPLRSELLAHARGRVLEIGGGTGFNLEHYPRDLDELVVSDPSPGMVRRLERRSVRLGPAVRIVRAPAERLPFADGAFDTVVSTFVLCSVGDQLAALSEIRRVLEPGGRLLFMEHVRADEPRLARRQDRLERPWRLVAFGCHPNRPTRQRIEAAGFELEAIETGELPRSPRLVRPLITGRAVRAPSEGPRSGPLR